MTRTSKTMKGLLGASALTLLASPAFAVGTAADTTVENTFSLTYSTGTTTETVDNNGTPTQFKVDRLINLNVTGSTTTGVLPGAQDQEVVFTVVNTGNDEHEYLLSAENDNDGGDDFDVTNFEFEYYLESTEATADGVCDGTGTGTVYNTATGDVPTVPADAVLCVIVISDIDPNAVNADTSDVSLNVETADGITPIDPAGTPPPNGVLTVENVFADPAGTFTGDVAGDGDASAVGTYVIGAATVTGNKAVSLVSQDGSGCGTFPSTPAASTELYIPGACVEYTISAVNGGGSDADIDDLLDTLPAELELVDAQVSGFDTPGTLTFDGAATAPATPTDCDGTTNCVVRLVDAVLGDGDTGTLTIHALVK